MSTRDLAEGQLPHATDVPTASAPTPGIALAAGRSPLGPTLPDPDPSTLTLLISRLAAEMFAAPPIPLSDPTPMSPPGGLGGVTETGGLAGVPEVGRLGGVSEGGGLGGVTERETKESEGSDLVPSPFSTAPTFDAVLPHSTHLESIPLIDGAPTMPVDTSAPYWLAPSVAEPAPTAPVVTTPYELTPTTDVALRPSAGTPFDPQAIRREFPILQERIHGKRLVWLDNAATTQKPQAVIDRLCHFYEHENSNVHRAAHTLAARATDAYESARETVRRFIGAPSKNEIVFVRGTTEGINLVAQSWGRRNVREGDEIVLTWLEHHANIVPWKRLCDETGARLRIAPVDDRGQVILEEYEKLLGERTRIVAFTQVSNALGTVTPAREMIAMAHRHGARVLLDGAQSVSHMPVDVQQLDCDFFVFSGHKVFAPTGIGVVYGKKDLLESMPPWQGGGNMIDDVTFERITYQGPPARFEAGTGNIADAVGLGAALDWLSRLGVENVGAYEHELLEYATECLATVPGLRMIGTAPDKAGVLSFVLAGQKTEEIGGLLDKEGIAVRSGHHCAQPILRRFGVEATVRASLAPYNGRDDVDALVDALKRLQAGHARP